MVPLHRPEWSENQHKNSYTGYQECQDMSKAIVLSWDLHLSLNNLLVTPDDIHRGLFYHDKLPVNTKGVGEEPEILLPESPKAIISQYLSKVRL